MNRKRALIARMGTAAVFMLASSLGFGELEPKVHEIVHDGINRKFVLHVPATYDGSSSVPLVLAFHPHRASAERFSKFSGFNELADENGFIALYPQGLHRHWNDGREFAALKDDIRSADDVGFVMALVEQVERTHAVDRNRIFAVGVSNGGMFCLRLAQECSGRFAAVAAIAGQLAEPLAEGFNPKSPVSVLIMNGTEDPIMPYGGGYVLMPKERGRPERQKRGKVIGTDETLALWVQHNKLSGVPETATLPDIDRKDGCTVEKTQWSSTKQALSVVRYRIIGGGHGYPGTKDLFPEGSVGRTCKDIWASKVVWNFFAGHGRLAGR